MVRGSLRSEGSGKYVEMQWCSYAGRSGKYSFDFVFALNACSPIFDITSVARVQRLDGLVAIR